MHTNALYQLGRFVVMFQQIEMALTDLLVLLIHADDEAVRILINDLTYSQRVKTTGALFSRFVDVRVNPSEAMKDGFAKLTTELLKLGERRNELLHSGYSKWTNINGFSGLIRSNSRLRSGSREREEEELLAQAFEPDLMRMAKVLEQIEAFRRFGIEHVYPDADA